MQSSQRKQSAPSQGQAISLKYNLYSPAQQIAPSPTRRKPQTQSKEITIFFHHPNLLYLEPSLHAKKHKRDGVKRMTAEIIQERIRARKQLIEKQNLKRSIQTAGTYTKNIKAYAKQSVEDKNVEEEEEKKLEVFGLSQQNFSKNIDADRAGSKSKTAHDNRKKLLERAQLHHTHSLNFKHKDLCPISPSVKTEGQERGEMLRAEGNGQRLKVWSRILSVDPHRVRLDMHLKMSRRFRLYNDSGVFLRSGEPDRA